jgi:hypothetical protein
VEEPFAHFKVIEPETFDQARIERKLAQAAMCIRVENSASPRDFVDLVAQQWMGSGGLAKGACDVITKPESN